MTHPPSAVGNGITESSPKSQDLSKEIEIAGRELSECLFSQYGMTFTGLSIGTAYALARRPPHGLAVALGAGVAGTVADLGYGWTTACAAHVRQWEELQQQKQQS